MDKKKIKTPIKLMVKAAYDKDRSDLWIISMFNHYDQHGYSG